MPEHQEPSAGNEAVLSVAFDDVIRTFETFKDTNDDRLAQLEKRSTADVLTDDKLGRIDRAFDTQKRLIDELTHKVMRPAQDGAIPRATAAPAHKAAFEGYVRKGDSGTLTRLESKALSVGSEADGGYLVPQETERAVNQALRNISPIRAIAGIRQVSSLVYKRPFATSGAGAGWVGETTARPQTGTPGLAELTFPTMELYAMPASTSILLDDAADDIDE